MLVHIKETDAIVFFLLGTDFVCIHLIDNDREIKYLIKELNVENPTLRERPLLQGMGYLGLKRHEKQ